MAAVGFTSGGHVRAVCGGTGESAGTRSTHSHLLLGVSSSWSRSHGLQHVPAAHHPPQREVVPQVTVSVAKVGTEVLALGHLDARRAKHHRAAPPGKLATGKKDASSALVMQSRFRPGKICPW